MRLSTPGAAGTALALLATLVVAAPAPAPTPTWTPGRHRIIIARDPANPTDVWVSVDESGTASTVTPTVSTAGSGSTTILSGAPNDVTATVFTTTDHAVESTSTGTAAATATNTAGAGAFALCSNRDTGNFAPFCAPSDNGTLYAGMTYYGTWKMRPWVERSLVSTQGRLD
jgi:hypothetical protein